MRGNKVFLLYRAQDKIGLAAGTSRIGLAYSSDGLHFTRVKEPVLKPKMMNIKNMNGRADVKIYIL